MIEARGLGQAGKTTAMRLILGLDYPSAYFELTASSVEYRSAS